MSDKEAIEPQVSKPSLEAKTSNAQIGWGNFPSAEPAADSTFIAPNTIKRAKNNPGSLTPANILALQRTIGNQAVQRLIAKSRPKHSSNPVVANPPHYDDPESQVQTQLSC